MRLAPPFRPCSATHARRAMFATAFATTFAAAVVAAAPTAAAFQHADEDWNRTLTIGTTNLWGAMVVADSSDHLYVAGSNPYATIVLAKLDAAGNLLWQVEYDHASTREQGSWIAIDPSGDLVVSGYLVAGSSLTPNGFVTLKFDPNGNLLWEDVIQGTNGRTTRIATDSAGNVVVLGTMFTLNSSGFYTNDIMTAKYAPDGTKLWTQTTGASSTSNDSGNALAVDPAGNVYVGGGAIGAGLVESYDPNGVLRFSYQNSAWNATSDLVVTAAGECRASGLSSGKFGVLALDAAGRKSWLATDQGLIASRLALDSTGAVVATGYDGSGGYFDWITHKFATDGTHLWSVIYDQHKYNDEIPYALTIGPDDEIYVTGQGGPGPTSGNLSYLKTVTTRYSKDGAEMWWSANDLSLRGRGVVRLSDRSIASVGESTFTVFHYVQTGIWTALDGALAGSAGEPHLEGSGAPVFGLTYGVDLTQALGSAPVLLVAGFSDLHAPLFGGTLVPMPDVVVAVGSTSAGGTLSISDDWPDGVPPGFEIYAQLWILDPAGPRGFAASNAVLAISQ